MTHVVEHTSFRFTWELISHTYILDLESEIDVQQVEISPSHEGRLLPPPCPRTSFFEVGIDQIQKNGKTVFSFRSICPVEMSRGPDWNPLSRLAKPGSAHVARRYQSQDGDTETRWLYTDDFFLISLSSGDRHDLAMLLSLIIGKLNMIALSVQSGKRIRSEFENQIKYRADMSSLFSGGVDGAFREVPVYQQHGEITESGAPRPGILSTADGRTGENSPEKPALGETSVLSDTPVTAGETVSDSTGCGTGSAVPAAGENFSGGSMPAAEDRKEKFCGSCGAEMSGTAKFCGMCGEAAGSAPPKAGAPASSGIPARADGDDRPPSPSTPPARLAIDLKPIEDLQDTSWLND